jgi:hypothetical protein
MRQDAQGKMHETREALAFVQAFMAETQPMAHDDDQDQLRVTRLIERATEPRAALSAETVRRLITRVECLT